MDFLSYFALASLFFVILVLAYGMIAIHDIPYHMALKREHPHADAIHAGGWISLFTLAAIRPFLWSWATAYQPEHGYAGKPGRKSKQVGATEVGDENPRIAELEKKIADLEAKSHRRSE